LELFLSLLKWAWVEWVWVAWAEWAAAWAEWAAAWVEWVAWAVWVVWAAAKGWAAVLVVAWAVWAAAWEEWAAAWVAWVAWAEAEWEVCSASRETKTRKVSVATVCLEHGKHDPNPRMKYKIVRLSEVNASPVVDELCKALANGKVSQNVAQAAAWHVANGLTWQELVQKPRVISQYTGVELYFSRYEVENAMRLVNLASQEAEKNETYRQSDSESSSIGEQLAVENKE
jgi:hypothetical protein